MNKKIITALIFSPLLAYIAWNFSLSPGAQNWTTSEIELLNTVEEFDPEFLEKEFRNLAEKLELKAGQLFFPIRISLTGRKESPPLFDTMCAIGKDNSIKRLDKAITIIKS